MGKTTIVRKPRCCPFLKGDNDMIQCGQPVTRHVFGSFCNVPNFEACYTYAEKMKKLKPPFQWLQHTAVEVGGRNRGDGNRR